MQTPSPTAASADTCTATNPPLPGQYWPEQAAWYAGIMRSENGLSGWHLLLPDGKEFNLGRAKWGKLGQLIEGANHRYDGHANTLAMAAAGSPLAKKIRKLPGDCHLASRAESALIFAILPERVEGAYYWTSTQYSGNPAWFQSFSNGTQSISDKSYEARCRAVRRLVLQSFNPSGAQA